MDSGQLGRCHAKFLNSHERENLTQVGKKIRPGLYWSHYANR